MSTTLAGLQCSSAHVIVPRGGAMWARVELADADADVPALGERVEFVVAGVTFSCTVTDVGARGGISTLEVTGGAGGWADPPPAAAGYRNDAGQRLSEVVTKLAGAVGETVALASGVDRALGPLVAVAGGTGAPSAGALLSQLCGLPEGQSRILWWVDPSGTTRLGPRLALGEVEATEVDSDERRAWVAYAEDDASGLMPGATIGGREVVELRIEAEPGKIREVCTLLDDGPAGQHTLPARLARWVLDLVRPYFIWRGVYTYRITRRSGDRYDATPVSSRIAPQLAGLKFWAGAAGHSTHATVGAQCLIAFADGNPNAPIIMGWMPRDTAKGMPAQVIFDATDIRLGPSATRGIARLSDTVLCTLPPAVFNGTMNGSTPISGAVVFSGSAMGTIQTASTKAHSE